MWQNRESRDHRGQARNLTLPPPSIGSGPTERGNAIAAVKLKGLTNRLSGN